MLILLLLAAFANIFLSGIFIGLAISANLSRPGTRIKNFVYHLHFHGEENGDNPDNPDNPEEENQASEASSSEQSTSESEEND